MSADFRQRLTFDLARGGLRDGTTRYVMLRMFAAVASIVFDAPVQAEEDRCASAGGTICRFSARLRHP